VVINRQHGVEGYPKVAETESPKTARLGEVISRFYRTAIDPNHPRERL